MVVIPHAELETDTLMALLEEIVTRDGTDYGLVEMTAAAKVQQVLRQLQSGIISLCFDEVSQTCSLLPADEARRLSE